MVELFLINIPLTCWSVATFEFNVLHRTKFEIESLDSFTRIVAGPDMLCVMLWQQRSDLDVKNGPFPASFYLFSSFQFSFE